MQTDDLVAEGSFTLTDSERESEFFMFLTYTQNIFECSFIFFAFALTLTWCE